MASNTVLLDPDGPPKRTELHASKMKLRDVLTPSYWQQLCPNLHVTDQNFMAKVKALKLPDERLNDLKEQINYAGAAQVSSEELPWSISPNTLANSIITLMQYGWPPSLIVMYDEVWSIIKQAEQLMDKATGGNACNMDILAWYVDPNKGHVGFSPHRDRQPDDSPATFRDDGTAMYATLWLPLTDATPEISCLYVIPRYADPGYYEGDPDDDDAPDPLTTALPNKEAYQNIRALPAPKGSATIFTHRTIHWGSKGRPGYHTPRISMSWGCADDAYEPAYFSREHLPCPSLELRLALAGAQMIVYHERFPAPPKQLAMYYQAFTAQADKFDAGYRAKVMREFVDASKEAVGGTPAVAGPAVQSKTAVQKGAAAGGPPAAAAAANGAHESRTPAVEEGKVPKKRSRSQIEPLGTAAGPSSVAAAAMAAAGVGRTKKHKRSKAAAAGASEPGAAADQQQQQRRSKRQKQSQAEAAYAPAAAGPAAAAAAAKEDSSEEGDGIDWAAVTAAATKRANRKKKKCRGKGASSSSKDEGFRDDDSDGDVMDLALDSMLDAELAGEGAFHDDYEDP